VRIYIAPYLTLVERAQSVRMSYLGKTRQTGNPEGAHVLLSLLDLRRPTQTHHLHPSRMIGFFYMPTMGWHGVSGTPSNTVKESKHKLTL